MNAHLVLTALAAAASVAMSAITPVHKYTNPTPGEMPIMGWSAIRGVENQTPERYREMRQCGFNLAFPLIDSLSEVKLALDASVGSGIAIVAGCSEFNADPEGVIAQIGNHPQLAGYFFKDEPKYFNYPDLGAMVDRVRHIDDSKLLYINLFPTYAGEPIAGIADYDEYVDCYLRTAKTGFLSYDHYTITGDSLGNTAMSQDYYLNLELISRHARRSGVPFWAFALSTAHYSFPAATRQHLRLQMFSNLAYGAQGLQYFTYWQFVGLGDSKDVPITNDGQRGTSWWLVRDLNREIQSLAHVFLGAEVIDVSHTGDSIPLGTHRLDTLPDGVRSITSSGGEGVLVSHFANGDARYMMILNRDLHHNQLVTVDIDPAAQFVVAGDEPIAVADVSPSMWLAPGDYLLYKIK